MNKNNETIYVKLLNEGTDVWRPVEAIRCSDGSYIIASENIDDTEIWEFPSGSRVSCVARKLSGGVECLVASEVVLRTE